MEALIQYAAITAAITPNGVALVREPKKPAPVWWKFPGGASDPENPCESAEECALRELEEETGLKGEKEDLNVIFRQEKESHVKIFFFVEISSLDGLKKFGDEGEEVMVFPKRLFTELIRSDQFHPGHRKIAEKVLARMR